MIDWQAIKTEYITTNTSYRKLADKYGVSRVQIGNVGKDENWVELRRQHLDRTVTKTVAAVESAKVNRAKKIQVVADKLLLKIEAMAERPEPLTYKAIRTLTASVKDLKDILGVRSELDEQEQKARIANLQKQTDKDSDSTDVIEVVFAAGPEEWNE